MTKSTAAVPALLPGPEKANLYVLSDEDMLIRYFSGDADSPPSLSFEDALYDKQYTGEEVDITETSLGSIVTVYVDANPDLNVLTFSLLVPNVNIENSEKESVTTIGIMTNSLTSIGGPDLVDGQIDFYEAHTLVGTADYGFM
jgi:hypothetical protein